MAELSVFQVAHRHARWLMDRQTAIANNIAHASSPGFRAKDVTPFAAAVDAVEASLSKTNERHLQVSADGQRQTLRAMSNNQTTTHSGNTVSLDQQLLMSNEVHQGYALNAGVVKSFHRMIMSAAKS